MHSPGELERLKRSWALTTRYLRIAEQQLTEGIAGTEATQLFQENLEHNELERALDALEEIGSDSRSKQFWSSLLRAAENMNLESHAARYRLILSGVG